jgi:hypothetical protein
MARKVAMVQPRPKAPDLFELLELIGNDRAFTVISHKVNTWVIHFEGDDKPKNIIFDGDRILIKESSWWLAATLTLLGVG